MPRLLARDIRDSVDAHLVFWATNQTWRSPYVFPRTGGGLRVAFDGAGALTTGTRFAGRTDDWRAPQSLVERVEFGNVAEE